MQLRDWALRRSSVTTRLRHAPLRGPLLAFVGRTWGAAKRDEHLRDVIARRTSANGYFGLKLHDHHRRRWFGEDPAPLLAHLPNLRVIRLIREDRVAQAVSWARALQTGRWASTQGVGWPARYNARLIRSRLRAIEAAERGWNAWLARVDAPVLTLRYEDVAHDLQAATRATLDFLGVRAPFSPRDATLQRQADATSAQWAARFRDEDPGS